MERAICSIVVYDGCEARLKRGTAAGRDKWGVRTFWFIACVCVYCEVRSPRGATIPFPVL